MSSECIETPQIRGPGTVSAPEHAASVRSESGNAASRSDSSAHFLTVFCSARVTCATAPSDKTAAPRKPSRCDVDGPGRDPASRSILLRAGGPDTRHVPLPAKQLNHLAIESRISSGFLLETSPSSTTTSRSTQCAPAFFRWVLSDGHDVSVRPLATSASTSVHGP
jgi:hypothetical protein